MEYFCCSVFAILNMSAEQISLILASSGLSLGVLICVILLLANKSQVHANRLLAITVFGLSLAMLQAVFIYTGDLIRFPHFFRIPSPLYYLSLSTSYLYVRSVVNDETRFKKYDLLLFLPALLHMGELLPFYLKSAHEKQYIIENLLRNPEEIAQLNEGLLPPYMHNLLRALLGIVFCFFMIRELRKVVHEGKPGLIHSATYIWLKWFTALVSLAVISVLLILILPSTTTINRTLGIHLSVIICFVILNFYLFFRPQILYGLPRLRMENIKVSQELVVESHGPELHVKALQLVEDNGEKALASGPTSLEYLIAYKPILELHLEKNKPYLQQGYNVAKLSTETGIPQHHLSALLNKVYGVRFNDFINQYRIKHITHHFDKDGWNKLTLEGMASEAGFNSRTTFFNAIKKSTGLSPSEYINKIKSEKTASGDSVEH